MLRLAVVSALLAVGLLEALEKPVLFKNNVAPSPIAVNDEIINFMVRYGYLEKTSDALFHNEEIITEAIKNVQKFAGTSQTGAIDEATLNFIRAPRCGAPDIIRGKAPKFSLHEGGGWKNTEITYFLTNVTKKLDIKDVEERIYRAFNMWTPWGELSFKQVYAQNESDITISFGKKDHRDSYPFAGDSDNYAHAFPPLPELPGNLRGDIHFYEDEQWAIHTDVGQEGIDLFTVALHQLGHALGLNHSTVPSAIMNPRYHNFTPEISLDHDDVLAMYELYRKYSIRWIDKDLYSNRFKLKQLPRGSKFIRITNDALGP